MAVLLDTSVAMEIMMAKIKLVTQGSPLAMPARASPSQSDSPESCKNKKRNCFKDLLSIGSVSLHTKSKNIYVYKSCSSLKCKNDGFMKENGKNHVQHQLGVRTMKHALHENQQRSIPFRPPFTKFPTDGLVLDPVHYLHFTFVNIDWSRIAF